MKLIAHRGLTTQALENTVEAFEMAGKEPSIYGIECDIQTTSDGHWIVYHDPDFKRLMGINKKVEETTFDEIRSYQMYCKKTKKTYEIPTLETFLKICQKYQKTAVIEIKRSHDIKHLESLLSILKKFPNVSMIFISFKSEALLKIQKLCDFEVHYLVGYINDELLNMAKQHNFILSIDHTTTTKEKLKIIIDKDIKIALYTLKNLKDIEAYRDLDIAYATIDDIL
jgi:glycerophosphoryl diester phosphodiesterase